MLRYFPEKFFIFRSFNCVLGELKHEEEEEGEEEQQKEEEGEEENEEEVILGSHDF